MLNKRKVCILVVVIIMCFMVVVLRVLNDPGKQTPVGTATFSFKDGVPVMTVEGIGDVQDIGSIAPYVLYCMGEEAYQPKGGEPPKEYNEKASIQWIKDNAEDVGNGLKGWRYPFDNTYNDVTIYTPWSSAFGQACGIEVLAAWYRRTGDTEALEIAKKAARLLYLPIDEGGLLFSHGEDIWFEEIPRNENAMDKLHYLPSGLRKWVSSGKTKEPSHILNGHMRACLALHKLYDTCGEKEFLDWYERGVKSLKHWLPLYDAGYWLRYDLNPRKRNLLFRFCGLKGEQLPEMAVDEIRLTNPVSEKATVINVGEQGDMDAGRPVYLSGVNWQVESNLDGRTVRRLSLPNPISDTGENGRKLNCYFYLELPEEWNDNLSSDCMELTVTYKDEGSGHLGIEQQSIAPDREFVALHDSEVVLTGSGEWRVWSIPVRPQDLGWPVGVAYAEKHMQYLQALARYNPEFAFWAEKAEFYLHKERKDK